MNITHKIFEWLGYLGIVLGVVGIILIVLKLLGQL
jgi:hypothetical protein